MDKLSPRVRGQSDEDEDLIPEYGSGNVLKNSQNSRNKFFLKGNRSNFLNEQHELSTIIEKELITSQRRSSNGGGMQG